jgi:hypothetical protein
MNMNTSLCSAPFQPVLLGRDIRRTLLVLWSAIVIPLHLATAADTFTRITTGPGAMPNGSSAAAWGDFTNDGWLDLFVTSFGGTQYNYCYTNNGDGTFTRVLPTFFPANNINSFGCAWADYDNDGYLDLVKGISNPFGGSTQIYHNNGNASFNNVTSASIGNIGPGANNVVWGDYDNDGYVDLFLAIGYNGPDNVLLHNRGNGTFTRITGNPMVTATGLSGGASWADYDNDGRLDLLVSRTSAGCLLYHNEGGGIFRSVTNQPFSTDLNGSGVSWGDYDNDGFLDVFVAHPQSPNRLYHNNGDGSFTFLTTDLIYQSRGTSSGGAWADYDNDGWLDLFVANSGGGGSFLFHNTGNGTFTRITNSVVATDIGTGQGAAWGDYDNDGFQDLLVPNIFTYTNFLYHNNGTSNAWLTVKLEGHLSNRAAIGAKVRLQAIIGGREFWQLREISGGGSLGSQNDLRPSFGLGDATNVDRLMVEWPSGIIQEFRNVKPRQFFSVIEPEAHITPATQTVPAGTTAQFRVSTTVSEPVDLQWRLNGQDLPGETNALLTIPAARFQDAGKYTVLVSKPATALSFQSPPAWLTGPVVITGQPDSVNVRPGSNAIFVVTVSGMAPFSYQWRFDGTNVAGATNASFAITDAETNNAGGYDVVVGNDYGFTLSAPAQLGILINPGIIAHPVSQSAPVGGSVTFSVAVTGSPAPFSFEWRRGSLPIWTNISNEPVSFFTLDNVHTNQAGIYRVVIRNAANLQPGVPSNIATLSLLPDVDGDGLPDEWESAHGLDPINANDASLDLDGDGVSNLAEFIAGTDVENADSVLRIDCMEKRDATGWHLQFTAVSNRTYSVQQSDWGSNPVWRQLVDVVAAPTNRTVEVNRSIADGQGAVLRIVTPQRR